MRALVKIEARRELGAKVETETHYAITSLAPNASEILRAVRLHWGIENGFHRCLDVAFREDASAGTGDAGSEETGQCGSLSSINLIK